ncbi:hypothetical protein OJF2_48980 [Aquisphaera giovannonii]|uniref:Uncharacterized protein n=1 Tax=Aquisphaera giovannonii TaxID=406548 RepID=A0A5B9W7L3_9BACT|nr:hypothetical protein [Aquisphaera giovannonii]QEH36337.1 hypothetical protein OJF2_48980 [Aquisphaera giovannonii]
MATTGTDSVEDLDRHWRLREEAWARKLGRLRLGAEPLAEQLARYRGATWALTIVPAAIAAFFVTLFAAFDRPDVGLVVAGLLFAPVVLGSWIGYARLRRRARGYLGELAAYHEERRRLAGGAEKATAP